MSSRMRGNTQEQLLGCLLHLASSSCGVECGFDFSILLPALLNSSMLFWMLYTIWFCRSKKVFVSSNNWPTTEWGGSLFDSSSHGIFFGYWHGLPAITLWLPLDLLFIWSIWYCSLGFMLCLKFILVVTLLQAQFVKAEKTVKDLSISVDLMKNESRKLLERTSLAEKDMRRGITDLT